MEPPVYIGRSTGGAGLAPVSRAGCHGRVRDGTGTGSRGYVAGLRQRHWRVYRLRSPAAGESADEIRAEPEVRRRVERVVALPT